MALLRKKPVEAKLSPVESIDNSLVNIDHETLVNMNKPEEVDIEAKEEEVFKKDTVEKLDVFFLRDFVSKRGELGIVAGLTRAIDYYHRIKGEGDWDNAPKIRIKNISNDIHNEGSWKVNPGEEILLPDFVAKRVVADFPDRLEIIDE